MRLAVRWMFLFLASFLTHSANAFQTRIHWPIDSVDPITITLVFSDALNESAEELTQKTYQALDLAEKRLGLSLRENFWIYFDSVPDDHNGLATVLPGNRIYVQTEAPFLEDSIGLSKDYLLETLTHELGHMIPLQQRSGIFSFLDYVVGNTARPVGLWPRWMHEGLAVWTESAIGGRPQSGYIHLQLRAYAENFARTQKQPLGSYDLDGAEPELVGERTSKVKRGEFPYHFGYLLLEEWRSSSPQPNEALRRLIQSSSQSLGVSFRVSFRSEGANLDTTFQNARNKWAQTALGAPRPANEDVLAEADEIYGPFASEAALSWIEAPDDSHIKTFRAITSAGDSVSGRWDYHRSTPIQAYWTSSGTWIALVRRPDTRPHRPSARRLWRLSQKGHRICEIDTPPRLREIDVKNNTVTWTRSLQSGEILLEQATMQSKCELGPVTEITRGRERFERISSPQLLSDQKQWIYSRSNGTGSFREHLVLNGQELRIRSSEASAALGFPSRLPTKLCGSSARSCWLAHEYGLNFWGPLLISQGSSQWSARRLPLPTGATRSSWLPNSPKIAVKESLWEKDRLVWKTIADFTQPGPALESLSLSTEAPLSPAPPPLSSPLTEYSPWPSFWPKFWIPMVAAAPGGFIVMGQSFYSDLKDEWKGALQVGYDSSIVRPFASTSLARAKLNLGPLSEMGIALQYSPVFNYLALPSESPAQDRWGMLAQATWARLLGNEWLLTFKPQVQFLYTERTALISSSHNLISSMTWGLTTASGVSPLTLKRANDLNEYTGLSFSQQVGYVKKPFAVQNLRVNTPLGPTALSGIVQYGITSEKNYPQYFEWGGLPGVATPTLATFPSRGFRPRMDAAREIGRASLEWQFAWLRPRSALSWNRARLGSLENRWIVETVTYTPFFKPLPGITPRKLGRDYFTSAGSTLDVWGSALQYVNFVSSIGLFRGWGPESETRVSIMVQGWLDL